jgi:hypothetical protein
MKNTPLWILFAAARFSSAADIQGDWIAEVSAKGAEPQYTLMVTDVPLDATSL